MQLAMRLFAAVLVNLIVGTGAAGVRNSVTPVQKVVQMLTGMLEKGKKEKSEEQVQFAAYKQFCDDTEGRVSKQIKEADEKITMLKADVQKQSTESTDLARQIGELDNDAAVFSGDTKAAVKVRELERSEYEKTHTDYSESIDAIGKAVAVMKKQAYDRDQAKALLQSVISFEKVPKASKRVVEAFLAKDSEASALQLAAAPGEASGYEFQSHSIIDMLEKLKDKFIDERSNLEKEELNQRHAHDKLQQDLKASIEAAEGGVSAKSQAKSKADQAVATHQGDLGDMTSTKEDDTKYLADLTSGCTQKSKDFEARQTLRTDELASIEKAIELLSEVPSSMFLLQATNHGASSLLQLRKDRNPTNQMRVAAYLNEQATHIGSGVLSMIATRVTEDPFDKVKKMIRDLITHLEEQAGEEAQHEQWCTTELEENEKVRKTRTSSVDNMRSEIEELTASISKAASEVTQLTSQVAELDANVAKETTMRQKDKAENEVTIKDAKDAQTAVARALVVLKEFYAQAATSPALFQQQSSRTQQRHKSYQEPAFEGGGYKGMEGESGGVIGMLEVVQSDFARLESDTTAAEVSQSEAHNNFMSESAVTKAQKQSDITHRGNEKQRQEQQLTDKKNDLTAEESELDAANQYFEKLKPSCLDAGMSFKEREARRQEEIQSLQEALRILNGEDIALLMQESL